MSNVVKSMRTGAQDAVLFGGMVALFIMILASSVLIVSYVRVKSAVEYPRTRIVQRGDGWYQVQRLYDGDGPWVTVSDAVPKIEPARVNARFLKDFDESCKRARDLTVVEEL